MKSPIARRINSSSFLTELGHSNSRGGRKADSFFLKYLTSLDRNIECRRNIVKKKEKKCQTNLEMSAFYQDRNVWFS